jgi:hypothetical protein
VVVNRESQMSLSSQQRFLQTLKPCLTRNPSRLTPRVFNVATETKISILFEAAKQSACVLRAGPSRFTLFCDRLLLWPTSCSFSRHLLSSTTNRTLGSTPYTYHLFTSHQRRSSARRQTRKTHFKHTTNTCYINNAGICTRHIIFSQPIASQIQKDKPVENVSRVNNMKRLKPEKTPTKQHLHQLQHCNHR